MDWCAVVDRLQCGPALAQLARTSWAARAAALSRAAHLARRAAASASRSSRPHPIVQNHAGSALPTVTSPSPTLLVAPPMQPVLLDTKALSVLRIVLKSVPSAFRAVYADLFAIAVRAVLRHLLDLLQRNSSARDPPKVIFDTILMIRDFLRLYHADFGGPLPDVGGLAEDVINTAWHLPFDLFEWKNVGQSIILFALRMGERSCKGNSNGSKWSLDGACAVRVWLKLHRPHARSQEATQIFQLIAGSLCDCATADSPHYELLSSTLGNIGSDWFAADPVLAACVSTALSLGGPFRDAVEETLPIIARDWLGDVVCGDGVTEEALRFCRMALTVLARIGYAKEPPLRIPFGPVEGLDLSLSFVLHTLRTMSYLPDGRDASVLNEAARKSAGVAIVCWHANESAANEISSLHSNPFVAFWEEIMASRTRLLDERNHIVTICGFLWVQLSCDDDRVTAWEALARSVTEACPSNFSDVLEIFCYAAGTLLEKAYGSGNAVASLAKAAQNNPSCPITTILECFNSWCLQSKNQRSLGTGLSINYFISRAAKYSSPSLLPPGVLDPIMNWILRSSLDRCAENYARLCLVHDNEQMVVYVSRLLWTIRTFKVWNDIELNSARALASTFELCPDPPSSTPAWFQLFLETWMVMLLAASTGGLGRLDYRHTMTALAKSIRTCDEAEAVFTLVSSFRYRRSIGLPPENSDFESEECLSRFIGLASLAGFSKGNVISSDLAIKMHLSIIHEVAYFDNLLLTEPQKKYYAFPIRKFIAEKLRRLDLNSLISPILCPNDFSKSIIRSQRAYPSRSRGNWASDVFDDTAKECGFAVAAFIRKNAVEGEIANGVPNPIDTILSLNISDEIAGKVFSTALQQLVDENAVSKANGPSKEILTGWISILLGAALRITLSSATPLSVVCDLLELVSKHLKTRDSAAAVLGPDSTLELLRGLYLLSYKTSRGFGPFVQENWNKRCGIMTFAHLVWWAGKEFDLAKRQWLASAKVNSETSSNGSWLSCGEDPPLERPAPQWLTLIPYFMMGFTMSVCSGTLYNNPPFLKLSARAECLGMVLDALPLPEFCSFLEAQSFAIDRILGRSSHVQSASDGERAPLQDRSGEVTQSAESLSSYLSNIATSVHRAVSVRVRNAGGYAWPSTPAPNVEAGMLLLFAVVPRLPKDALTVALECIALVTPARLPTDDGSFEMAFAERLHKQQTATRRLSITAQHDYRPQATAWTSPTSLLTIARDPILPSMTTGPANRADSACDISRDGLSKAPPSPAAATTTIQPDCEGASNLSTEKSATAFADDVVKCPTPLTLRQFLCTPEPSHNAKLAFDDYRTCDVILSLLPTRRLVFGHKKILADASDYFRSLFTTGIAGQLQQHVQIEMPASERAMLVCLAFMYDPSATCKPPATAFVRSTPPSLTAVLHGEVINLDEAVKSDFVSMFKTSGFLKLRKISTICLTTFVMCTVHTHL
ncbi:hypothetical protein DFJ73DRAFT_869757 [Zopfochytrium polystomum]|nr:hypothetical protein DFJ73DRAFT_869757 [Zopfochytrium polystomum]